MHPRGGTLFRNTLARYLFAIATVASAFVLRLWLIPLTSAGAPFVLFFGAILVTSRFAGVGPGICAVVISMFLGAYTFGIRAGYSVVQTFFQSLLFAVDGFIVVYLMFRMNRDRQAADDALQQLRGANEEITRTNDEIARTMSRTREIVELSPDAFFQADLDARFTDVNEAACRLLGYRRDELVGKTIFDIIPVEDAARLKAVRAELLLPGRMSTAEWTQVRKDGTRIAVEVSSNILPDGRWQAFVRDISERKRVERTLYESQERFRLTIDEAPIGMALVALDGHFVRVNGALCEIVGYTSAELTGLTFQTITHPDDLDADLTLAGQLLRGDIPRYQLEKRYIRKDGTVVDILLSASILRGRDGVPLYYIAQIQDITERKRAEEALRTSEREWRELAESMPQIVWTTGPDGLNTYFNQQWADYTGLTLEESYGEGWITPFHPDDRQRAWDAWQRATQHRDTYSLECRLRRADGVYQWWLVRGVPLLGANGDIRKWFGTCTDIEQVKIGEQRLKESEAKFSGIISISADAIISIDDEQRITIFNDGAERIFGYPKAEVLGSSLDSLIPERFRTAHRQHVDRFASADVVARRMGERLTTIVGLRKSGEEFPAEASISKLQVGERTLLTVALRDITERKRVETEQRFLAEAGTVLAASLDYEQTLAAVAQLVVRDLADWCMVEVMEEHDHLRRLKVASADPTKAALCARLEQVPLDSGRTYLTRSVIETKQPLLISHVSPTQIESAAQSSEHLQALRAVNPTSLIALPLLVREQLMGAIAFISSKPSRLYGPSDLPLVEALASRIAISIQNARLYRASVHATRLRDEVLGIVAHDLRNPLGAIRMQAAMLRRGGPEHERRSQKASGTIERAATRMNRLIQDLLDVAIMESGQLAIQPTRLRARDLITTAVDMQRPLASSSSLELRYDVDDDVPDIWGDQDRLLQVFENLIGNAIKFTKAGGCITVGAAPRDHQVIFRVEDTGAGIAAENLPHVFDRFWQATRANRQGAGLGLPITKGIVEAHGGRIWVESTPNRGTTFFFAIPEATPEQGRPSGPSGSSLIEGYRAA